MTAAELAKKLQRAVGFVAGSFPWKLNRRRLRLAKSQSVLPTAISLNESAVNAEGAAKGSQRHDARAAEEQQVDEIEARGKAMLDRITEYSKQHPTATTKEIARACRCKPAEVAQYKKSADTKLQQLISEQEADAAEDTPAPDADAKGGERQKWVKKRP